MLVQFTIKACINGAIFDAAVFVEGIAFFEIVAIGFVDGSGVIGTVVLCIGGCIVVGAVERIIVDKKRIMSMTIHIH